MFDDYLRPPLKFYFSDCRLSELTYGVRQLVIQKLNLEKRILQQFLTTIFDRHTISSYRLDEKSLHLDLATDFEMGFSYIETRLPYFRVSELICTLQTIHKHDIAEIIIDELTPNDALERTKSQQRDSVVKWNPAKNEKDNVTFV